MNTVISEPAWGYHMNDSIYTLSCPPCPKWAKRFDQQNWNRLGVVVWDAQTQRITHMFGSQTIRILEDAQKSKAWKKKGLVVGTIAYRITMPADKKVKGKVTENPTKNKMEKDDWCLTNTIQLSPSQTKEFLSYLEQNDAKLKEIIAKENEERSRILGKVYSLILSWRRERKAKEASITPEIKQDKKPPADNGTSIPQGKYYTITQVAEMCAVTVRTVTAWLKKEKLHGVDLPGMGKIIEEKELIQFIKENRQQLMK
ncbi:MAG: hypothetical protein KPEEDBHJ_00059 [Anaerolineales bacterium]|nr:hypothetical protein [Anaerolineales bacterium]HAX70908.1 hypothetical protein [Anaerolineae bacterium]HRJ55704.1 helix-turn-helix domain-containing protein [Anaerolineales bacterium]HRK88134.1 helix-turn-helix domain-containing protein [Anaerolineales bacterium]